MSPYKIELISQPDVFLVSFLFGRIILTFFIGNVIVSCILLGCVLLVLLSSAFILFPLGY